MRVRRKIIFWGLLFVTMLVQNAGAALTSSYYDGFVYYDKEDGYLRGRIDFAVYDQRSEYESVTGLDAPGDGTYVYAYQIFNNLADSDKAVAYFSILGIDETTISGLGAGDDGSGKKPAEWYVTTSDCVWKWNLEGTNSYIYKGDHSWLLVFSSNQHPVEGSYDIRSPGFLVPDIPEPSIFVLLGVGSLMMLKKRAARK